MKQIKESEGVPTPQYHSYITFTWKVRDRRLKLKLRESTGKTPCIYFFIFFFWKLNFSWILIFVIDWGKEECGKILKINNFKVVSFCAIMNVCMKFIQIFKEYMYHSILQQDKTNKYFCLISIKGPWASDISLRKKIIIIIST